MSGRIIVVDSDGIPVNTEENTPALGYEYYKPSAFDQICGSYGIEDFQRDGGRCPGEHIN